MKTTQQVYQQSDTDTMSTLSPESSSLRDKTHGWTWLLALAAVSTTVGSAIPFGYNIGVINTPAPLIKQWCNESLIAYELSAGELDVLWSTIVSIFLFGGMIGSLAGSWCADYLGRKRALVVADIFGTISAIMFFTCKPLFSVSILLIARFIIGLSSGLTMSVMPMYLMELAPASVRGAVAVLTPCGVCLGVLLGQFMGLDWILGTEAQWHYLLSLYLVLIAASALALPVIPESPKYLYLVKGSRQEALKELTRLRSCPVAEVAHELGAEGPNHGTVEPWTVTSLLAATEMRLPLALVCALQCGQQLAGINAVFYYSTDIFRSAGLSPSGCQYANLGAGAVNFLIAVVMILVVNNCRRRTLLHISCILTTLLLVLLAFSITYMDVVSWMPSFSTACVMVYVLVYGIGLGPIPYFIGSELFGVGPRPPAMALGSAANWTGNLLVGMMFPTLQRFLKQYSFFVFASFTALLGIFVHLKLPETFNQTNIESPRITKDEETPLAKNQPAT